MERYIVFMSGKVFEILRFEKLDSTMDKAFELAKSGCGEWTVVVAEEQSMGRGRRGRKWVSPRGGLWFSIVLKPKFNPIFLPLVGIATSLSCAEAIEKKFGLKTKVKWPNDVYIDSSKVGGVLVEALYRSGKVEFAIVGVGLNTNVHPQVKGLDAKATSLSRLLGREIDNEELLEYILDKLREYYLMIPDQRENIIRRYLKHMMFKDEIVKISINGRWIYGKLLGIDDLGRIVIRDEEGYVKHLNVGEVERVRRS